MCIRNLSYVPAKYRSLGQVMEEPLSIYISLKNSISYCVQKKSTHEILPKEGISSQVSSEITV